jgi:hypothetical protein
MTKKDYILIAEILRKASNKYPEAKNIHNFLEFEFSCKLEDDNARFNKQRFLDYINK